MRSGLLFTLFAFPLHSSIKGNEGGPHMRSNAQPAASSSPAVPVNLHRNVQIMQTDNKEDGFTLIRQHIPEAKSNYFIQIVFQYEKYREPTEKYYHSFTIEISGDKYANTEYVKFDGLYDSEIPGEPYFTLEFAAPYLSRTPVESFSDYEQKLDRHIDFATDHVLIDMAYNDKNYHDINICDNYRFVQELLSRLNGSFCHKDKSLLQREVYLYKIAASHALERFGTAYPSTKRQMDDVIRKYRVSRIKMKLSDWKPSFARPNVKGNDFHDFMIGPRKACFYLYVDRISDNITDYDKDIRPMFSLFEDDDAEREVYKTPEKEKDSYSQLDDAEEDEKKSKDSASAVGDNNEPSIEKDDISQNHMDDERSSNNTQKDMGNFGKADISANEGQFLDESKSVSIDNMRYEQDGSEESVSLPDEASFLDSSSDDDINFRKGKLFLK